MDEIGKIYNEFQQVASLVLNDTKSTLFSAIESDTINKISKHYKYENKTNDTLRHLGFFLKPSQHADQTVPLRLLEDKVIRTINNLKKKGYLASALLSRHGRILM